MMLMTLRLSLLCQAFYDQVMFVQNDTFQGAMLPVILFFLLRPKFNREGSECFKTQRNHIL